MAGIFDKVVVGLNKGVSTVSEGSKLIIEKAKLNTQIQETEKQRAEIFRTMGNLIYNLQKNGEIHVEQCEKMCNEIGKIDQHLAELHKQLQMYESSRMQEQFYAPQSGIPPEEGITCGQCGFVNSKAAKFCARCGKPLEIQEK